MAGHALLGLRYRTFLLAAATLSSLFPAQACLAPPDHPASAVDAIYIRKDADFKTNPAVSHGSGTPADPYLIENREMKVGRGTAIEISGTSASFVIRNVIIGMAPDVSLEGFCCATAVRLDDLHNGRVESVTVDGVPEGIFAFDVANVSIVANRLSSSGLSVQASTAVTLAGNILTNSTFSLVANTQDEAASQTISEDNLVDGAPVVYRANCGGETVHDRAVGALIIANCTGTSVQNVSVEGPQGSLRVYYSESTLIDGVSVAALELANDTATTVSHSQFQQATLSYYDGLVIESSTTPPNASTWVAAYLGTALRIEGNSLHGRNNLLLVGGYPGPWCSCLGPEPPGAVSGAVIANNTLEGTTGSAIVLHDAPQAEVVGNTILNYSEGVDANDQAGVLIEGNTMVGVGGTGIAATGERTAVRNNRLVGYETGIQAGSLVEVTGNRVQASGSGISISDYFGNGLVSNNALQGGAVTFGAALGYPTTAYALGLNNTVNGLQIELVENCVDARFGNLAVGELVVIGCQGLRLANLTFADISQPLTLLDVTDFSVDNVTVVNASLGLAWDSLYFGNVTNSRFNGSWGLQLMDAVNVRFDHDLFQGELAPLSVTGVAGITLTSNRFEGGQYGGALLTNSQGVTLRENAFVGGSLVIWGSLSEEFATHDIDESNTVNGLPIVYLRDLRDFVVANRSIGELILVNSTNVSVADLNATGESPVVSMELDQSVTFERAAISARGTLGLDAQDSDGLRLADSRISLEQRASDAEGGAALSLGSVSNVSIVGANISSLGPADHYSVGLEATNTNNLSITGSAIGGTGAAASIEHGADVRIRASLFSGAEYDFFARSTTRLDVAGSRFTGGWGIQLNQVQASSVEGNDATATNGTALSAVNTVGLRVANNSFHGAPFGVDLRSFASALMFENNSIAGNGVGLSLEMMAGADTATIVGNTVEDNGVGAQGNLTAGVTVYHNRFLNNTVQARVSAGGAWDAGYLIGGNFWSDYSGTDKCSGPNQDVCPDPDQFGDTPYCLGSPPGAPEAVDRYPLMHETPPPPREAPPPSAQPGRPTTLDPIGAGLPAIALVLAAVAAGAFLLSRRKSVEKLEWEEGERPK